MNMRLLTSSEGLPFNMSQGKEGESLLPAVVVDRVNLEMGQLACVRMLGYMNRQAVDATLESGFVTFYSRSRDELWQKGASSGNLLRLIALYADCDNDSLLALVNAVGPTCHYGTESCFEEVNDTI